MNDLLGFLRQDGVWVVALAVGLPLALILVTELGLHHGGQRQNQE